MQGTSAQMTDPNSSNPAPLPQRVEAVTSEQESAEPLVAELLEQGASSEQTYRSVVGTKVGEQLASNVASMKSSAPLQNSDPHNLELHNSEPLQLHSLDPAFVTVERIGGWIFSGVLLGAGFLALVVVAFNFGIFNWVIGFSLMIYFVLGAGLSWLTHVLPKKQHAHAGWCLTNSGLEIRQGVWWRSQISVPLARVQHTDVHQGPLLRRFGLAKLTIHTAGTENSAVVLNGLRYEVAQRLRDALIENRGEIDGV